MPDNLSLGRIQAGFASATQELTVAAAQLNFDFSLVKLEAPPEYQAIANVLSPSRVHEAETGPLHMTARRLGALFKGVSPQTPNLIKAYGIRASDISRDVTGTDSRSSPAEDWIHTEYGGIDATTIWAAATSSRAALPVHLLACIIARMWKHSEATSIWFELVTERKREIITSFEQGECFQPELAPAVQQEITRMHLAKWDASARAWLQTADEACQLQYKQFLLIVQNINIAIHEENMSLYSNVIHVWTTALATMESLVSGRPHVVRDGPTLLGMSAWHIFPNMVVFNSGGGDILIEMKDALVKPGGVISLGTSGYKGQEERGVYWSLSLAHHKFYGEAVSHTRRLDSDGSRMSLTELILVCLGCLFRGWEIPIEGMGEAFRVLQAIPHSIPSKQLNNKERDWRSLLGRPIDAYLAGEKQAILGVSLGRRRPRFLPAELTKSPRILFQLTHLPSLLFLLKGVNRKIELLRRLGSRIDGLDKDNSVILCFRTDGQDESRTFASVFAKDPDRANMPEARKRMSKHRRWVTRPDTIHGDVETANKKRTHSTPESDETIDLSSTKGHSLPVDFDSLCAEYLADEERWLRDETVVYLKDETEPWFYDTLTRSVFSWGPSPEDSYGFLCGQADECGPMAHYPICEHAAIYCKGHGNSDAPAKKFSVPELTFQDVLWCFESGFIDPDRLDMIVKSEPWFGFLIILAAICEIYKEPSAGGATISSAIVDTPFQPPILQNKLDQVNWATAGDYVTVNRYTAIGLIGYFETATNIIEGIGRDIFRIIGLSGGDSIFVPTALLKDPQEKCPDYYFTRILGNTGQPGVSMLVLPTKLDARKVDPGAWIVEPVKFDGTALDSFRNTSLHLSFTEWSTPIVQLQAVGQRVSDVNIIEAVVSVRDAGKWIADVDICKALDDARVSRGFECTHYKTLLESRSDMYSFETWDQVLDCNEGQIVVRCPNNWVARLALLSVLCQHSRGNERKIIIWSDNMCRECKLIAAQDRNAIMVG